MVVGSSLFYYRLSKIELNIRVNDWHTGMYDSTAFPTSYQLAGRPPTCLGALPGRLAAAAHCRSLGSEQRGRQPVAEPGQGSRSPSPTPLQASRSPAQIGPPAAAPVAGTLDPRTPGLGLSWRRLDPT